MSAWTWTYVRAEALPDDMTKMICKKIVNDMNSRWYMKMPVGEALERWFEMHETDRQWYIEECGMDPSDLERNALERKFEEMMKNAHSILSDLESVVEGKMKFPDFCRRWLTDDDEDGFNIGMLYQVYDGSVWVHISEIFRLRKYTDMTVETGIKTVEGLLEYLRKEPQDRITGYYTDLESMAQYENEETGLTERLEGMIREYYGRLGDGNFSVEFG